MVRRTCKAIFLVDEDEWDATRFELSPLSEQLALVLEDWGIWKRFEAAYKSGAVSWSGDEKDWGALPSELPRRRELSPAVAAALSIDPSNYVVASGTFRAAATAESPAPIGVLRSLEVSWAAVEVTPQVI